MEITIKNYCPLRKPSKHTKYVQADILGKRYSISLDTGVIKDCRDMVYYWFSKV